MGVTAKDVAQRLGVSPAAVSLALRGRPGVSEGTRERILETARQMGYPMEGRTPDKSGIIQMVIYKRHGKVFSDTPFFEQLTEGVAEQAGVLGYHLSVSYFYGSQNHQEQLRSIRSLNSAGIILLATEMRSVDMQLFFGLDVPIVVLDNFITSESYDLVGIDNRYGAWNAVRYLISCGHTRLGYLHSSVDIRNFSRRYDGYLMGCRCLPEAAAKDSSRRVVRVGTTPEAAASDMRAYLATDPVLPTAFFADNDSIAAGCCRALQEGGLRIPQDVSVIGFDDQPFAALLEPPLTSVHTYEPELGAAVAEQLIFCLEHPGCRYRHVRLGTELMIRESTQPKPQKFL